MKYVIDHDYHLHSGLSLCSGDPEQTAAALIRYGEDNNYRQICITDHFWDEKVPLAAESHFYQVQNLEHIRPILPLPQGEHTKFLFGCETDLDKNLTLGVSGERMDLFDMIVIPINHLHMDGFTIEQSDVDSLERRAVLWAERMDAVLDMDLPFERIGLAHLTDGLTASKNKGDHVKVFSMIEQKTLDRLFEKAEARHVGIELNFVIDYCTAEEMKVHERVFSTAKRKGCRFYFGSDSHHPKKLEISPDNFRRIADLLDLTEDEKFTPAAR